MKFDCEHCSRSFSTKHTLNTHQKNAKYCLKLRDQKTSFSCEICEKDFTEKRMLIRHTEKCGLISKNEESLAKISELSRDLLLCEERLKERSEQYEERLKKQAKQYEELLKEQAKQANEHSEKLFKIIEAVQVHLKSVAVEGVKKHTNNTTNNLTISPLTDEHLKKQSQYLTQEHVNRGLDGYVDMAANHSLKGKAVCTDVSRRKFKFVNKEGNVVDDVRGMQLAETFFRSIKTRNDLFIQDARNLIMEQIENAGQKDSGYLAVKMLELINIETGMKHISSAKGIELRNDFTKKLCFLLAGRGPITVKNEDTQDTESVCIENTDEEVNETSDIEN